MNNGIDKFNVDTLTRRCRIFVHSLRIRPFSYYYLLCFIVLNFKNYILTTSRGEKFQEIKTNQQQTKYSRL